ncbi:MAG: HD domain-containing protein [Gemmataceae bacterium]|nr:HD domain-containing protein [Gemmataceae bacterium]
MTDTQVLLSKIAALRQRLEQAQGLIHDAGTAAASLLEKDADPVGALERKVATGARQTALLDGALKQLPGPTAGGDGAMLPAQLTARAARLLKQGRDLLSQLRALGEEPQLERGEHDPLAAMYRETASMTETVIRTIQAFPESPSAQIRLCEGLEVVLSLVADRLTTLTGAVCQRQCDHGRIETLADLLAALAGGLPVELQAFTNLAESVLGDAQQGRPLRFLCADPREPARFVAAHSLMTAQVIVRLTRHDPDWRGRPLEPILAALVHDVGMLNVPGEVLAKPGPLNDDERRLIETHPIVGAEYVGKLSAHAPWVAEAAAGHHERLDGTGYPAGLRDLQIKPLVRLLAVCDMYAALCSPRPHRPALETRTALTDTLLLAEKGVLDRHQAERLLQLGFYPVGSLVELADGAVGLVVATHGKRDLSAPARPVVALLMDNQGRYLPMPVHVDLAECEGRSILRSLPSGEMRELLGRRYPEWA